MKYEQRVNLFRERIHQLIRQSNMSYSRFADSIGVDRSTLSQLLSPADLRLPRASTLATIAEKYHVSVDWLLGLTESGSVSAQLLTAQLEVEDFSRSPISAKILDWHREAVGYRVRYVPANLPYFFKTKEISAHEERRYGLGHIDQHLRYTHILLVEQRREEAEMEVCQSFQEILGFARGEGIWDGLSKAARAAQLEYMINLMDELYPRFRWFLFDGRKIYTAVFTIFGPLRAVVFVGQSCLVFNSREYIRLFSRRFDQLIRHATVQPHEICGYLRKLITDWL